eukprot:CAMPEP_0197024344 /NCGR_PEP_ID=MMETSP1384-20130603/4895_1 /TAXON_ID=29189 /ORGANISM="Ammonia sp." /LENGTH=670 /DNA_ID=CAMNT_0042452709 /DNA_START=29 /DNA_END=2038 /DNA_ORIENTATION=-
MSSCLPFSFILLSALLLCGECYLDISYTPSTETNLASIITSSQDRESGLFEKSLVTTFYASEGLFIAKQGNIPNSDKLCNTLKSYKISSWEEFHNLLVTRSRIPNCLEALKDSSLKTLKESQTASKLSKVYYAVNGIHALSTTDSSLYDTASLDVMALLKHLQSFQLSNKLFSEQAKSAKSKSSVHKSSMALLAVARLLTLPNLTDAQKAALQSDEAKKILSSFVDCANALVKDYNKIGDDMLSYSSSLTATSLVLESINDFLTALQSVASLSNLATSFSKFEDKKYVESVVKYVLTFRTTTSATSARHVIVLMNMIKSSVLFKKSLPFTVTISNRMFNDAESKKGGQEKPLTLSITNVFGQTCLASNEKTAVKIVSAKESKIKKEGPTGSLSKKDANTFSFDFGAAIRKLEFDDGAHGIYSLKISVADDNLDELLSIQTSVKVLTAIQKAVFGVQYSKKSDEGYNRVTYPDTHSAVYDVSPAQKVKLEVQVRSVKKPSQIVIDFVNSDGESVLQVVPKTRQDKYGITIDLGKEAFAALNNEGQYTLNLIVADALYRKSLIWSNILKINCIEEEDEAEVDYEPVNDEVPPFKPKENIEHTFAAKEPQPLVLFPMVFCGVVALPFLCFMYYVLVSMGTSIAFEREIQLSSLLFMVSLCGVGAVLCLFWWQW